MRSGTRCGAHLAVRRLAHAVQALHLERRITGHAHDGRDRARVVRGELRIDHVAVREHRLRAGKVGEVGVLLVREHRVAGQPHLLRPLDLRIPVGALHQPHHEAQAVGARDARHFVDELQRARLVGLHRQAEAAPLRKRLRDAAGERLQHVERQLQPIALLGVDRQVDVGAGGLLHERPRTRQQLGKHTLALRLLVAREQGRQLDRDAVGPFRRRRRARPADRARSRRGKRPGSDARPRRCARPSPSMSYEKRRPAWSLRWPAASAMASADGAAQHELPAEQLDRAHGGRHHRPRPEPLQQPGVVLGLRQQPLRHCDGGGREAGQHAMRPFSAVGVEVGAAELVGSERDRGLRVRHAQQRLGQPHQRQPLGRGDRVLAQQRLHGPERRGAATHRLDPRSRGRRNRRPVQTPQPGQRRAHHGRFRPVGKRQPLALGRCGEGRVGSHDRQLTAGSTAKDLEFPVAGRRTARVPTRTIVAPSAIAASRSALMPMDSVSSARPSRFSASSSSRRRRCGSRCAVEAVGRLGNRHQAAQSQAGQRGDLPRHRAHGRRRQPALARLAVDVHLQADVQRRPRPPAAGRTAAAPPSADRRCGSSRSAPRPHASCCSAAGRSGAIRCPGRRARPSWPAPPARSSRRSSAGRRRGRPAGASLRTSSPPPAA